MAVSLLSHELSDLCLGKPALRSLSITSTIAEALEVLKTSDDNFVSIWNCDDDECCSRCVGKVCIVDVICYLCKDENFVSPSIALKQPVSVLLPKIPGLIIHVEPSCSLLEAIDLILEGAQNLVVPIKTRVFNNKRSKQQQKPFCWLTQEDIIRFLLSFIGLFSPISSFSIDTLNIISPNTLTIEYHSPASAAIGAISRALVEQTSVAVVDSERILIGEISPFTLACCDETVAAALKTLSSMDLMAYIDCGGLPEELVKVVSAKLKEKNMNGMLQHFTVSMSCGGFSSSSSSDEEYSSSSMAVQVSPFSRPGRISRSMSYSARMVRRSEAIVCHPKSSLVAVMIQAIAHRVNYVWVIEEDCSLVGIVTFSDMLKVVRGCARRFSSHKQFFCLFVSLRLYTTNLEKMGGSMGNPIDDATQARINDRIKEVLATFGTEFSKAYTRVVIDAAKSDLTPDTSLDAQLKLDDCPPPEHPLKTGILVKRGDVNKNWKSRFFVAYNAKDNFKIDYLDGSDEKGKLKGTIHCAGYYATEFNSDEIDEYGENGIKLVPWSYRRRTWYIKCGDNTLRSEWLEVFRNACYKARPPHDENEVIAKAFDIALRNTRWQCWIWGWYYGAGTEAERLGELLLDVLDRDIINEVIGNIVEGPAKSITVDLIRKTIGSTVNAACSSAWISSAAAVRSVSDKIESTVKDLIGPVIEKQQNLKEMIVTKVSSTIDPFLADKGSSLFTPVVRVIFRPIIRAFNESTKGFYKHVQKLIQDGDFAGDKFRSTLNRLDWQMDWWSGPVGEAYQILYRMYTSDLNELLSILASGSSSTIYNLCTDRLKTNLHRAVYNFGVKAGETSGADLMAVLNHVTGLLFHDAYIMIQSTVKQILNNLLSPMITENVVTPAQKLIAPLQETIDAIPIPGLSALLDLNALLEETVGDIQDNALTAVLRGSLADIRTELDLGRTEIGVGAIAF